MSDAADLNPTIVEALYGEALALAEEARDTFDLSARPPRDTPDEDLVRIALSCEALRTTTRMMHAIAWLLNQRAYFAGELSEQQLRRYGVLPGRQVDAEPAQLALVPPETRDVIERTQSFCARIERLDRAWRERLDAMPPVHVLRERLARSVASL